MENHKINTPLCAYSGEASCDLQNWDDWVDQYIQMTLPEADMQAFETRILACERCFTEVRLRKTMVQAIINSNEKEKKNGTIAPAKEAPPAMPGRHTEAPPNIFPLSQPIIPASIHPALRYAAVAIILIAASFAIAYFLKPTIPLQAQASISPTEKITLLSELTTRSADEPENVMIDFQKGAVALQKASDAVGMFSGFDQIAADSSIFYFERFYHNLAEDHYLRNHSTYYIAKAYLMKNKPEIAQQWLKKVVESDIPDYQAQARSILSFITR